MSTSTSPQPMSASTATSKTKHRPALTAAFDREWRRLRAKATTRARLADWAVDDPDVAPYGDLDDLLAATGRALPIEAADQVLAAVVRRAATDDLAATVAFHRILPGLVNVAVRRGATGHWRVTSLFDELTAASWIAIRTYPIERRPTKVAVNLLRDAEYQVCVRPFRVRAATEVSTETFVDDEWAQAFATDATGRLARTDPHASDEVVRLLSEGRVGGVPSDDLDLLRRLHLEGEPVHEAAARLTVTPRTVLSRRMGATRRLRAVAA